MRPPRLSVTDIENWLRDPYTIYAKYILRLAPLDPVDMSPGAAERGTIIHAAVGEFTERYAEALPPDPEQVLIEIGDAAFCAARRFSGNARVLVAALQAHRALVRRLGGAAASRYQGDCRRDPRRDRYSAFARRVFKLVGRADRIERHADGRYIILDYKTGSARTEKQVRTGLAPQLTLEAAILRQGGFAALSPAFGRAGRLRAAQRRRARPGEPKLIDFINGTTDEQADYALQKLTEIAQRFDDQNEPYRSLVHPMWTKHYGDYDHLARVKEWSATGGEIDDFWGSE